MYLVHDVLCACLFQRAQIMFYFCTDEAVQAGLRKKLKALLVISREQTVPNHSSKRFRLPCWSYNFVPTLKRWFSLVQDQSILETYV